MAAPDASGTIELPSLPGKPEPVLAFEENVAAWPATPGFRAFWGWCQRRCDRIQGREIMRPDEVSSYEVIRFLMDMLEQMIRWVEEVPALEQSNQRFGNLAFRSYYKLIEESLPQIWQADTLPAHLASQAIPLLLDSTAFGQPTRLDYGTGHELAFMLVLWCCVASGWTRRGLKEAEVERVEDELILRVFPRYVGNLTRLGGGVETKEQLYLDLVTLLQQTYRLEPAGSHGVWGLDDYCFFPYLFGSAQLLGTEATPTSTLVLANSSTPTSHLTDLYTLSLRHIKLFKTGAPFSEHSPLLYNLSTFPNWHKPHFGLRKMFLGEVAGKRVVVQGLFIGGWCWAAEMPRTGVEGERRRRVKDGQGRVDDGAAHRDRSASAGSREGSERSQTEQAASTAAPWAKPISVQDGRAAVLARTRADWGPTAPR